MLSVRRLGAGLRTARPGAPPTPSEEGRNMTTNWQSWLFWPDKPALSLLVLVLILLPFMYASRHPVHGLIHSVARAAANALRLASRWLPAGADELRNRNKLMLLAHAEEEVGSRLERE